MREPVAPFTFSRYRPLPAFPVMRGVSDVGRRALALLFRSGGLSQAQVARSLGLPQPNVARLLQTYLQDGLVRISRHCLTAGGLTGLQVTLNSDFAYSLGVSMTGGTLTTTLLDFSGRVRAARSCVMTDMTRMAVLDQLQTFKAELLAESAIDARRIIGTGVSISGYYAGERSWIDPPAFRVDWSPADVEPVLRDILSLPVTVENDGYAAACGESLFGVGRRCRTFAYLLLTNGFAGGIVEDGKPLRGCRGNVGDFGGVWAMTESDSPSLATPGDLLSDADATCPRVDAWVERAAGPFAKLSAILAYCFDPEAIVVAAGVPRPILSLLVERIRTLTTNTWRGRSRSGPRIEVAEAEGNPVSLGSAVIPLRNAFFA